MKVTKSVCIALFSIISFCRLQAQAPDSLRQYVMACVDSMQNQSLYAGRVNWKMVKDSVAKRLSLVNGSKDAEETIIWVFNQLKDAHGMYAGIDTTYRYISPGPRREFSKGILAEYQKPRAVKIKMLNDGIAYYKMPAILIGSDTVKMKQWANKLADSLVKLESQRPKAYIIDLRMNNGGNIEPMWQVFKGLIGEKNRTFITDRKRNIIADETDSIALRYRSAAIPDRTCTVRENIPVAVLIGPGTASSGEIMALSFSTRKRTKIFGEPSIGVANVTNGFIIQNKGYLLLTVGYIADSNKKILSSGLIQPDIYIKSDDNYDDPEKDVTIQAAIKWLKRRPGSHL